MRKKSIINDGGGQGCASVTRSVGSVGTVEADKAQVSDKSSTPYHSVRRWKERGRIQEGGYGLRPTPGSD